MGTLLQIKVLSMVLVLVRAKVANMALVPVRAKVVLDLAKVPLLLLLRLQLLLQLHHLTRLPLPLLPLLLPHLPLLHLQETAPVRATLDSAILLGTRPGWMPERVPQQPSSG